MPCRTKRLTPHFEANVYSQWARGYSRFNITVKWNYRFLPRVGPAFRAFARPSPSQVGSAFGIGRGRCCPLSVQSHDLGKRVLSSWPPQQLTAGLAYCLHLNAFTNSVEPKTSPRAATQIPVLPGPLRS